MFKCTDNIYHKCVHIAFNRLVIMPSTLLLSVATLNWWSTSFQYLVRRSSLWTTLVAHVWTWPLKDKRKRLSSTFSRRVDLVGNIDSRWALHLHSGHLHKLPPDKLPLKKLVFMYESSGILVLLCAFSASLVPSPYFHSNFRSNGWWHWGVEAIDFRRTKLCGTNQIAESHPW